VPNDAPVYEAAFVYTANEGMKRLRDYRSGETSGAFAIDREGRVIGGYVEYNLSDASPPDRWAYIWVDRVMTALDNQLKRAGVPVPSGWKLHEVTAISSDGLVLVGNGTNPAGHPEAFRVVLANKL
jgi:uncharacterized membrane protein